MEKINADLAKKLGLLPPQASQRPIRVIQFGEGNFLRAFVDWTFQKLNDAGLFNGNVAIVQPIPQGRAKELEEQDCLYTVILQGRENGEPVKTHDLINSVSKAISVYDHWDEFLALADDPDTDIIVSNTTEAGIALDGSDTESMTPPSSYPAKLAHLLKRRFDKKLPGFLIIPCELIDDNGQTLRNDVISVARTFGWGEDFIEWITNENTFVTTLVDRIVPGFPKDDYEELWNEIGYQDDSLVTAEPFYSWMIAGDEVAQALVREKIPADKLGINLIVTDTGNSDAYHQRKVFLLNSSHTSLAFTARLAGFGIVRDAITDPAFRTFITDQMDNEAIPVLNLDKDDLEAFASDVIERFDNPYIDHSIDSIALNSVSKFNSRMIPLIKLNMEKKGVLPQHIVCAFAGLLFTYGGLAGDGIHIEDTPGMVEIFQHAAHDCPSSVDYAEQILADKTLWGEDLSTVSGLAAAIGKDLDLLKAHGMEWLVGHINDSNK
jgi:tagaturonate reductase